MLQRQLQCILVNYSVHPNSYSSGISSPSLTFPIASISVAVQGTANASLHETWIKYEEMFNCLDEMKRAFNAMGTRPTWIREIQTAIEKMWSKLPDYYSNTERPLAFIDFNISTPRAQSQLYEES